MKIAYISSQNIQSVLTWSGTVKNIFDTINSRTDIEIIPISVYSKFLDYLFKLLYVLHPLFGYTKEPNRNIIYNKIIGWRLSKKLKNHDFDYILSPGSLEVSNLKTNIPIVIWTDALFKSLCDSYPQYSNLTKNQIKNGNLLEQKALKKSKFCVFAASWVVKDALDTYKINKEKIKIIPFGSNISAPNETELLDAINKRSKYSRINMLFIGADWQKKGGDLLLKIFNELSKLNKQIRLHVVGSKPNSIPNNEDITFYGFLNKSIKQEKAIFEGLFKSSHYFILPTKAEAFGIVFCEASSYGIPSIGSDLGGIKDVIVDNKNGIKINIDDSPHKIAKKINSYISEGDYKRKALLARREYEERLNWDASADKLIELLKFHK